MSIIPVSFLSSSDLAFLGNNLRAPTRRRSHRSRRRLLAAVNRSLAPLGERVGALHRPVLGG